MRSFRGILVLVVAALLGLAAAKAVFVYLNDAKPRVEVQPAVTAKQETPHQPLRFTDSIPAGMRAVSIKVDEVTGVSRKVSRGDWVDVLATTPLPGSEQASVSRLVVERVKVLDMTAENESRVAGKIRGEREWTVTLLVTPEQGATVVAAASEAKISLLARGSEDAEPHAFRDVAFTPQEGAASLLKPEGRAAEWVRPGMRAITLAIRDTDGICGTLRRGDRVDVIVTCPWSRFASGGDVSAGSKGVVTEYSMSSRTLLQDVEVLVSEKGLEVGTDENVPVSRVTLHVTPQDAEKLAVAVDATSKGLIRLVTRNGNDRQLVATEGQDLAELLMRKREYSRIDVYKGTRAQVKPFFQ